ncbi:fungal-specific transcription factor domain-containing protein, partial [Halenospora varia]
TKLTTTAACDLCFAKKIKCNMLKPACSNCILYQTECCTTAIRRRADPPKLRPTTKSTPDAQGNSKRLNKRLDGIERQLQRAVASTKPTHAQASAASALSSNGTHDSSFQDTYTGCPPWKFDPVKPSLYYGPSDKELCLPPLHDIMPIIDDYFHACNKIVPLFCEAAFLRLITGWYNKNPKRDKVTWAAILVVIALGLRSSPMPGVAISSSPKEKSEWEDYCMRNSQSVMSDLVAREHDLLGIQVLLALIMLFYNSSDGRPANILVGTAIKLSQRFQLHLNASAQHFTAEEVQQRLRVFWIAYIFDKDISLRTKAPSVQHDADIDVPLPIMILSDGTGLISTKDGHSQLEFFRLRLDLAYIEGKIYDLLYSTRSIKVQGPDRQRRVTSLQVMLDRWYARIPAAFQMDRVSTTVSNANMLEMITGLYHTYLICITSTHGIYSAQAEWMRKVDSLSRVAIQDFALAMHGPRVMTFMQNQDPPLPDAWDHCVDISRGSMKLFQDISPTEGLIWQCSCAHFSALIILLANILISPAHESIYLDLRTATKSIRWFEQLVDVIQSAAYEPMQRIIIDLYKSATTVVSK